MILYAILLALFVLQLYGYNKHVRTKDLTAARHARFALDNGCTVADAEEVEWLLANGYVADAHAHARMRGFTLPEVPHS